MDIYIARQPIFDRQMQVYGYELLHRQGTENKFSGMDDVRATEELIYNSFLVMDLETLTDKTLAFINFPKSLVESKRPGLLPNKQVVIEVLERGKSTQRTLEACRELREEGYTIALDDFTIDEDNLLLLEVADIVKVEYPAVSQDQQKELLKRYRGKTRFLAEKIETREDLAKAKALGYDFFQGYFFSKPVILRSKEVIPIPTSIYFIMEELSRPEPRIMTISGIVERDLGLSYKLLKMANTVYCESKERITSISRAIVHIGLEELRRWMPILLLKDMRKPENAETVKLSIIRGKLMDLIAMEVGVERESSNYFFTGMFSFIDVLMNQPMEQILEGLPLTSGVKGALLGVKNSYRNCLNYVIACETATWDSIDTNSTVAMDSKKFMRLYYEALEWTRQLNY